MRHCSRYLYTLVESTQKGIKQFRAAGASLMGVHWMHSTRPEDLRDSAGCTASFEFPPVYDS